MIGWYMRRVEHIEDTIEGEIDRIESPYSNDPVKWEPTIHGRLSNYFRSHDGDVDS